MHHSPKAALRRLFILAAFALLAAAPLRAEEGTPPMIIDCGIGSKMVMVRMTLAQVPAGETMVGSPDGKGEKDERPAQQVRFEQPFYMGIYEVTQAQYEAVMGKNPSVFASPDFPVERVSWYDAVEFCKKLSARTGERIRLPTEAEWEYACRAGSLTPYFFGSDESKLGEYAWTSANNNNRVSPVGVKKPNAWGLYDMHGNVWEWCQSLYKPYPYRADDGRENLDAPGPRVLRGGGWFQVPGGARSAFRAWGKPSAAQMYHGFRVVLIPWPAPAK